MQAGRHTRLYRLSLAFLVMFTFNATVLAEQHVGDPHYTAAGFFDIHICNWPDQSAFFMALFSTTRYDEVAHISVSSPNGAALGDIPLTHFRLIQRNGKADKRVFITQIPLPDTPQDGWYQATVTLHNGEQFQARDYVIAAVMDRAQGMQPAHDAEGLPVPEELRWSPVSGAAFYQVFIRDLWDGEKTIYTSRLLTQPRLSLPPGLLQPGGFYAWRVHARDINEHIQLGDFNAGSVSAWTPFTLAEN